MAQPNQAFKDWIDRLSDPELLETERRSLRRLLSLTREAKQFRQAAAKTAYIQERLKTLAEEEATEDPER
jgi:hypothetical protein